MVDALEESGELCIGGTVIETTSGNTGFALAMICTVRGYRCILVTNDKISVAKLDALKALGAEVEICPSNVDSSDPRSYYERAKTLQRETPRIGLRQPVLPPWQSQGALRDNRPRDLRADRRHPHALLRSRRHRRLHLRGLGLPQTAQPRPPHHRRRCRRLGTHPLPRHRRTRQHQNSPVPPWRGSAKTSSPATSTSTSSTRWSKSGTKNPP